VLHSIKFLAIAFVAGCAMTGSLGSTTSSPASSASDGAPNGKLVMIDLHGKTADEALAALHAAGFTPSFEVNKIMLECDGSAPAGRVRCQAPAPGAVIDRHAIINVHVEEGPRTIAGALVRAQLERLHGMSIPDAKTYLKSIGHDGEVAIFEQHTFSQRCGVKKVCSVEPESGTGIHDRVTLVVNPSSVEISQP
jgi:beta-lactam-binding protein with PASTA domain